MLAFDASSGKSLADAVRGDVVRARAMEMCVMDTAVKEAAVARFLREHPEMEQAACDHPALLGCADVDWSKIPGCPAGVPALLRGLLDEAVGPETLPVLENLLMNSTFHVSAVMPAALPFLIRLAAVPDIAVRPDLVGLLAVAAELSSSVDADDERRVLLFGKDSDHPEREGCRAAFAAHASALRALLEDGALPAGLISADDRACLLRAVEPQRCPS
ncbi:MULTISPECIES: hypothetical protein [Streptomyces]|uniref:Uncharacterized protein n=2 Tax=Streptomyces TaxID=1883 RepID=A0A100Y7C1_9ACTN|nr:MULTISPECIES: hypothetical protein [Streptomyces]KUH39031.1 hypothetical protein ATE80_09460 [Streptomyces kanasensis]UUS34597.1 hypothetical protein NRO40_29785 [Streptomyces changanensis]